MFRMMAVFILVQNLMRFFFNRGEHVQPTDLQAKLGSEASLDSSPRIISGTHIQNYLKTGTPFAIDAYLSFQSHHNFFRLGRSKQPDWHEEGLTYDFAKDNQRDFNLSIPVSENMRRNNTLYLHFQVTVENPFYKDY